MDDRALGGHLIVLAGESEVTGFDENFVIS